MAREAAADPEDYGEMPLPLSFRRRRLWVWLAPSMVNVLLAADNMLDEGTGWQFWAYSTLAAVFALPMAWILLTPYVRITCEGIRVYEGVFKRNVMELGDFRRVMDGRGKITLMGYNGPNMAIDTSMIHRDDLENLRAALSHVAEINARKWVRRAVEDG